MKISLPLAVLLCLPVMAMADPKYHRLRKKKKGKAGKKFKLPSTTFGYVSTDQTSTCFTTGVVPLIAANNFAACSRYWYNGPLLTGGQSSTCTDNPYVAEPLGNTPANGNPADNTCLGVGDSPSCFVLKGVNNDEPVLVRTSVAWDWSEYAIPFASPSSSDCGPITTLVTDPSSINTCATILTNSSIPVVAAVGQEMVERLVNVTARVPRVQSQSTQVSVQSPQLSLSQLKKKSMFAK